MNRVMRVSIKVGFFAVLVLLIAGCPRTPGQSAYNAGYLDGFLTDSEYWQGYEDSYDTVPDGPILYSGSEIPWIDELTYEAGYYDGLWFAYNDGYFVSYDYGFTIGFSEGYDVAFHPAWYDFLINDAHPEYLDGSFIDGYNDGFSEGSVFGAVDWEIGLPFDWEDAMWDYRAGTDLYIEEVGFGTGEYGNVYLYEYGTDPNDFFKSANSRANRTGLVRRARSNDKGLSPRIAYAVANGQNKQDEELPEGVSYRELIPAVRSELNRTPAYSPRFEERGLTLTDSWLQRIERYRASRQ